MDEETPKKGFNPTLLIVVVIVLVAGGYFLFSNNQAQQAQPTPTPTTVDKVAADNPAATGDAMEAGQVFDVEGGSFYYKPNEIRVKVGEKVTINFTSVGPLHDFVIDEFDVKTQQLAADGKETVEFTPDKAGTFEFYCSVGNHRQMGMVGTLIVEE